MELLNKALIDIYNAMQKEILNECYDELFDLTTKLKEILNECYDELFDLTTKLEISFGILNEFKFDEDPNMMDFEYELASQSQEREDLIEW